ncbi:uncharacterized protein LOC131664469 [Phymastichus coffea]|uniref:uncharacterized protein LOC131664469 n=1 Tax=Phymastichus coffea TaxID=108790 RepID=UPI00273B9304|nr:uncharacterized protein LOC131664469 [Phymastichus coffea]
MLSVAQAVRHSETPGSASQHSMLGRSWSSDRSNLLKRRKTDSDCYVDEKKLNDNSVDILSQHLIFNSAEITLTPIPKNSPNIKDLLHRKIKTGSEIEKEQGVIDNQVQEEKSSNRILSKVPPQYRSILENNEEIQLTTLGSNEHVQFKNQKKTTSYHVENNQLLDSDKVNKYKIVEQDERSMLNTNINFSEVTIKHPFNKSEHNGSSMPNSPKISTRSQTKLDRARDFLKKKEVFQNQRPEANLNATSNTFNPDVKYNQIKSHNNFSVNKCKRVNSPIVVEELDEASQDFTDYEPFNIGIPCETYYPNIKERPHYTTGFPNPAGENRCWTNATLQALFALPILDKLDSLYFSECSKLMSSLINIQKLWRKGITNRTFDNVFNTFKEELSSLDELYSSRAQQDVSEFVMNLLNFIGSEFEAAIKKNSHQNEIENIPNNEQDSTSKLQSIYDINKRLPLSDISAVAGQVKSNCITVSNNNQENIFEVKHNVEIKSINQNEVEKCRNPINEYFSSYMMEKYVCDCCLKQRSQKVENLMLFIDLPSEDYSDSVNLIDMINKTFAKEQRSMTCESCRHDAHTMESKFKKLPKILILQVKRYEMTSEGILMKKSTCVHIPRLLKLDSLVINNCQDVEYSPEFEPVGIISHIGDSINSGHYISFVKHHEQWFYYDDMNVSILSADEVFKNIQNNAYVIFFQDTKLNRPIDLIDEQIEKNNVC